MTDADPEAGGTPAGVPAGELASPGLLAVTVAALQDAGRLVSTDWEMSTFDVLPVPAGNAAAAAAAAAYGTDGTDGTDGSTLGVVLTGAKSVVFYAVWPEEIPPESRPAVAELALRMNVSLTTSAMEFDTGTGILSVRSGLRLGDIELGGVDPGRDRPDQLGRAAWGALLLEALDEVEEVAHRCRPLVDDVLATRTK